MKKALLVVLLFFALSKISIAQESKIKYTSWKAAQGVAVGYVFKEHLRLSSRDALLLTFGLSCIKESFDPKFSLNDAIIRAFGTSLYYSFEF